MDLVVLSGYCVGAGLAVCAGRMRCGGVGILVEEEEVCIFGVRSFDITVWYLSVRYALPEMGSAYLFYVYLCVAGF